MPDKRIALVTGANQGVGRHVAKELATNGLTVLVGSRNFERGEAAARLSRVECSDRALRAATDEQDLLLNSCRHLNKPLYWASVSYWSPICGNAKCAQNRSMPSSSTRCSTEGLSGISHFPGTMWT